MIAHDVQIVQSAEEQFLLFSLLISGVGDEGKVKGNLNKHFYKLLYNDFK